MSRLLVTIHGTAEDTNRAREVVDQALTAAGFPPARPALHIRAMPDVSEFAGRERGEATQREPNRGTGSGSRLTLHQGQPLRLILLDTDSSPRGNEGGESEDGG